MMKRVYILALLLLSALVVPALSVSGEDGPVIIVIVDTIDEDWILDDYGIRDWVESLPTKSISLATIANSYKIIGL